MSCDPMDCSLPGSSVNGISRQEYWSGLPFPFPGDFPDPEIKPGSPELQADSLLTELPGKPPRNLTVMKLKNCFSEYHSAFPAAMYEGYGCSTNLTTCGIVSFHFSHSNQHALVPHCSFNEHFLHVLICHPCILSIQIFCSLLNCIYFLIIEF